MGNLHSKIGASSCERYWNCPGSITLYGELSNPPSFYAAQGTAAHTLAEEYLAAMKQFSLGKSKKEPQLAKNLGRIIDVEEDEKTFRIPVDAEMIEAVGEYTDFVEQLLFDYECSYKDLRIEVGFELKHIDQDAYGTADGCIVAFKRGRLVVLDYKHGAGVSVEVEDNKQTRYYGLGAYYELTPDEREKIQTVEFIIAQPRCPHSSGTIRREVISVDDLLEWEAGLVAAVRRVRDGDTTTKAGSHCKFCPGKPHCEEAQNEVMRLAEVDFASYDFGGPPVPNTLSPEEIAHLLPYIPFIKDWCKDLLAHAHAEAERGVEIPGYKLADKRSDRKWKDGVEEELEFIIGEQMYVTKLVSPAQAEKLLPKKSRSVLDDLWEKPKPGKTLVRVEDGREERLPTAHADYINVDFDSL